jgi:hypothetical protein
MACRGTGFTFIKYEAPHCATLPLIIIGKSEVVFKRMSINQYGKHKLLLQ